MAITLAEPREHRLLQNIERITKQRIAIEKVPTVADLHARRMEITRATLRESIIGGDLDRYRAIVESLSDEFDIVEIALAAVKLAHQADMGPSDDDHEIPDAAPRPSRDDSPRPRAGRREERGGRESAGGMTRIYIGAGRSSGIRPQDLVGAIANEAGVRGKDIGAIEIADRFSLVEVPDASVDQVIRALKGTTIKGSKPAVRRERFTSTR